MLYQWIQQAGRQWPALEAVALGGRAASFGQLAGRAEELAGLLAELAGQAVGLAATQGPDWVAAAGALDKLGCRAFLLPAELEASQTARIIADHGLAAVIDDARLSAAGAVRRFDPGPGQAPAGSVVLFTSGTSGEPKAALHSWASLASGVRRTDKLRGSRMLLAYDLTRYAGLQVLLTALLNGARLSVPESRDIAAIAELIVRDRVSFVSATPTFWRMLLANTTDQQQARMELRQVTLGGEAITQPVLDGLKRAFPAARITHIYASTEMGVCFSVHDGLAGFPVEFLNNDRLGVLMDVRGGRLWIRSDRSMAGYLGGRSVAGEWFDTGDAVEVRSGRVYFLGRQSTRINVGGEKVYPEEVEAVVRQVDGVGEVRVSGLDSSIVGQLVQAEVVPARGADREELRRRINDLCRRQLAPYKQPRVIRFVDNLVQADTMKIGRRKANGHG